MATRSKPKAYHIERPGSAPIFVCMQELMRFLWDEGPHTPAQLSDIFEIGRPRLYEILVLLRDEGQVEPYKTHGTIYWKVCDHVKMDG